MEASVAESSDSDNGGMHLLLGDLPYLYHAHKTTVMRPNCQCKLGAECHCSVPRKRAPRQRKKDADAPQHPPIQSTSSTSASPPRTPSHILARLAELRPVLPRPSIRSRSGSGPHDPSSGSAHGHSSVHRHEHPHFSPYGRAYDANFDSVAAQKEVSISQNNFPVSSVPTLPTEEQVFRDQLRALETAVSTSWMPPPGSEGNAPSSFPSTCGCGDNCRCPGCVQHNPDMTPASSAFSSCMNPSTCTNCLDCTILSLPASLPPNTALSIFDAYQTESIDDWIREVSSLPRIPPRENPLPPVVEPDQPQWDGFMPPVAEPQPSDFGYSVKPCCGVLCKCTPETCECELDDESGYDCRREMLLPTFSTGFPQHQGFQQLDNRGATMPFVPERSQSANGVYFDAGLELGRFASFSEPSRSRSSSTSSSYSQPAQPAPPHQQSPFTTQPLSQDYSHPWQPPGRVVRGSFYAGQTSMSSPNLGLRVQTEANNSWSRGSSPASVSSALSAPGSRNENMNGTYAVSNSDSDGYGSTDDRMHWRD
ncbi:hypothetical protein C0991_004735 [Blastosporella zonata]|nr:hypothetical protein C0991_004735 [Blastosporella zonata]